MKRTNLTDKELIRYMLGSFQIIHDYLKKYTFEKYNNDLKIQDACCYRIYCIGIASDDISDEFKAKYSEFPWLFYSLFTTENDPNLVWELTKESNKIKEDFSSLLSFYHKLEEIYLNEYNPTINKSKTKKNEADLFQWSNEYKYPIKASQSIWTVKKK